MKFPRAPMRLENPPLPDNYDGVADQLSKAFGPYPVILRRNGLLDILYASMATPLTAIRVGLHGGPRFNPNLFADTVRWAVREMGPHPNDWTLATLYMRMLFMTDASYLPRPDQGAASTGKLSFNGEKSEKTLNRLRRLEKAALVYRVRDAPDVHRTKSHELVWYLTEEGKRAAVRVMGRYGWTF